MTDKESIDKTIIHGYLQEYMENIEDNLKQGKVTMGYELNKDGSLKLANERVFDYVGMSDDMIELLYDDLKDCQAYIKAVKKFNKVYNNIFLNQKAQIEASLKFKQRSSNTSYIEHNESIYEMPSQFDINLVLLDTCLLCEKLADNDIVLANKDKFKLLSDKIEPKTEFIKMVNVIELAFKNYKKFDRTTQKQLVALVKQTIGDAENFN